jgi:hypothetical protein
MKGRDLSKHRLGHLPEHGVIELGVPDPITIEPAGEGRSSMYLLELDLAVAPDDDVVGLVFSARALYEAGLRPIVPVEVISSNTPVRACSLLLERPAQAVSLAPGMILAHMIMVETAGRPIGHDPYLALHASPDDLPFLGWPEPDPSESDNGGPGSPLPGSALD